MKIPKELQGKKAEKFEDEVFMKRPEYMVDGEWDVIYEVPLDELGEFYRQPFTPELIEELFEGWKLGGNVYFQLRQIEEPHNRIILPQDKMIFNAEDEYCEYPIEHFKTLSDFISACNNSGIELKFKESE